MEEGNKKGKRGTIICWWREWFKASLWTDLVWIEAVDTTLQDKLMMCYCVSLPRPPLPRSFKFTGSPSRWSRPRCKFPRVAGPGRGRGGASPVIHRDFAFVLSLNLLKFPTFCGAGPVIYKESFFILFRNSSWLARKTIKNMPKSYWARCLLILIKPQNYKTCLQKLLRTISQVVMARPQN